MKEFKQRGITEILSSSQQPEEVIDQPITLLLSQPQGLEQWSIGRHKNGQSMPISISVSSNTSTPHVQFTYILQETFNRAGELATRYGGEEFTIILPSINRAEAEKQAQRLINNLEHRQIPHIPESVRPYVTMSIGIAQLSAKQDLDNYHTLLEAADDALYKAKENGRNQLAWAIEEE